MKALDTVITRLHSKTHIRYDELLKCLIGLLECLIEGYDGFFSQDKCYTHKVSLMLPPVLKYVLFLRFQNYFSNFVFIVICVTGSNLIKNNWNYCSFCT